MNVQLTPALVRKHIPLWGFIVGIWALFLLLDPPCPIEYCFALPCPTCGVMSALLALLRFDFASYVRYQPFALPLAITVLLFFHLHLMKNKTWALIFGAFVLGSNTIWYVCKVLVTYI